ncbi:hypothetical protein [Streptomyces sp. CNQ085]|uniref:hypothetical protein n=1 Tax=Streptomyces sp. CNQ085 TaxID=2886944 RepID=UPI001F513B88|nr:hypothetical protein [Streptomyces sp. CNQ085]MCI0384035.1 hypothetical protein [Streptomyces sp. CNQ085]
MSDRVLLRLRGADGEDAERLELATSALREELLELDVERVEAVSAGPAPDGTRAVDVAEIGGLLVTLAQVPVALHELVTVVRQWMARGADSGAAGRTAELTIDGDTLKVTGVSAETQDRIVDAWLRAHTPGPSAPSEPERS